MKQNAKHISTDQYEEDFQTTKVTHLLFTLGTAVGSQWQLFVGMKGIWSQTIVADGGMKTLETFMAFSPVVAYNPGMLGHDDL